MVYRVITHTDSVLIKNLCFGDVFAAVTVVTDDSCNTLPFDRQLFNNYPAKSRGISSDT